MNHRSTFLTPSVLTVGLGLLSCSDCLGAQNASTAFRTISIEAQANRQRASFAGGGFTGGETYPTSLQDYLGVPISHGSDSAYAVTSAVEVAGENHTIEIPIGVPGDSTLHLALGVWCRWPNNCCNSANVLELTVDFDDGTSTVLELRGGIDLRDTNQGAGSGGVCTPTAATTREVWRNVTNQVLDLVRIELASPGRVATTIRFESPNFGFWTLLFGITAEYREDCDGNGVVDLTEILENPKLDRNGDHRLDRCTCPADIDENTIVDGVDLAIVLSRWGTLPTDYPRADTNGDGTVDGSDLAVLLSGWGACP
jgi:hypothetical protein